MPRPITLEPRTPEGRKIREFLLGNFGSIDAGAKAAGADIKAVRRLIYGKRSRRRSVQTVMKLVAIGVPLPLMYQPR